MYFLKTQMNKKKKKKLTYFFLNLHRMFIEYSE